MGFNFWIHFFCSPSLPCSPDSQDFHALQPRVWVWSRPRDCDRSNKIPVRHAMAASKCVIFSNRVLLYLSHVPEHNVVLAADESASSGCRQQWLLSPGNTCEAQVHGVCHDCVPPHIVVSLPWQEPTTLARLNPCPFIHPWIFCEPKSFVSLNSVIRAAIGG